MGINSVNNSQLGFLLPNLMEKIIQAKTGAVQTRLGVSAEIWVQLVAKYIQMTGKKYAYADLSLANIDYSKLDRTVYFDEVEIEANIKLIIDQIKKDAATVPAVTSIASTVVNTLPAFTEDAPQVKTTPAPPTAQELADIKKKEDQKKMLMYGGIGLGVATLLGVGIWYFTKK